ncbi:MAG: polysaccharide deacetylase family protein [Acidobacteriota bacterium]
MQLAGAVRKLKKSYQKNFPEIIALRKRLYPEFVFERHPRTLRDQVPVFTIHSPEPEEFEAELDFLRRNGYGTLKADELLECLIGSRPIPQSSVVLTFDDGWGSVWSVAYPLLQKYGCTAVCFLIPGLIEEAAPYQSNLRDCWAGRATIEEIAARESGPAPLCTWAEVREMHDAGVIDFQSHSLHHQKVFVSDKIEDFVHPSFEAHKLNFNVPVSMTGGEEEWSRRLQLGMPLYEHAPRYAGRRRYHDDEALRRECVEYVRARGGESFFGRRSWRRELAGFVHDFRARNGSRGFYEREDEMRENVRNDMADAKRTIESHLPGKTVRHLCFPWFAGSELAVSLSKEAGYLSNLWGVLPGRRTNRRGDDPYHIVRLLFGEYIFRLPGAGRMSLLRIMQERARANSRRFLKRLAEEG